MRVNYLIFKGIRLLLLSVVVVATMPTVLMAQKSETDKNIKSLISKTMQELYKCGEDAELRGELDSALFYYNILQNKNSTNLDKQSLNYVAMGYARSGTIYYNRISYAKAMECFSSSILISEANQFENILGELYKNIGNVYSMYSDFEHSRMFYLKSLEISRKLNDLTLENKVLNNLIGVSCFTGEIEKAKSYFANLRKNKESNLRYEFDLLMTRGLICAFDDEMTEAKKYYKLAGDFASEHRLGTKVEGSAYSCLSRLYADRGKIDSALFYLHKMKIWHVGAGRRICWRRP